MVGFRACAAGAAVISFVQGGTDTIFDGHSLLQSRRLSPLFDWSKGEAAWKQAASMYSNELWQSPNNCDGRALPASAPLTTLFGISKFWAEIEQHRNDSGKKEHDPLEIHVLGAAYPFEGRGNWSLLSERRPPSLKKVRVVLVLGTPWQADNAPQMKAKEWTNPNSLLLQIPKPVSGKIVDAQGTLVCDEDSPIAKFDQEFTKDAYCRDYGNGLEVVCLDKYYQDVWEDLPKPDLAVMFSPGYPQFYRRTWDVVLTSLLSSSVPMFVGDVSSFTSEYRTTAAAAPADELMKLGNSEGMMTHVALEAYGARSLGAFRNPFPIVVPPNKFAHEGALAKNVIFQAFFGRDSSKPLEMPSDQEKARQIALAQKLHAVYDKHQLDKECMENMLIPTSSAYDLAMRRFYIKDSTIEKVAAQARERLAQLSESKPANVWATLAPNMFQNEHWGFQEYFFLIAEMGSDCEIVIDDGI